MADPTPPVLPRATPIPANERLLPLDVLRGIALFGILSVNMNDFRAPDTFAAIAMLNTWAGHWDIHSITALVTGTLMGGKWITIYSLLFGVGIQLMCQRITSKGVSPVPIVSKRLGILLLIGLFHAFFIWFGDILVIYSIVGFGVLLCHRAALRINLLLAAIFSASGFFILLLFAGLACLGESLRPTTGAPNPEEWFYQHYLSCLNTYAQGSWWEVMKLRSINTLLGWAFTLIWVPQCLALMLAGAWAVKTDFLSKLPGLVSIHSAIIVLALLSLPFATIIPLAEIGALGNPYYSYVMLPFTLLTDTLIALSYVLLIIWFVKCHPDHPLCSFIATAGRMPLTNYLSQSVIATLLFYSYGLAWYGKVAALPGLLIALAIYGCQLVFSYWWMSRHRYGPIEKLWRKLSYGKV